MYRKIMHNTQGLRTPRHEAEGGLPLCRDYPAYTMATYKSIKIWHKGVDSYYGIILSQKSGIFSSHNFVCACKQTANDRRTIWVHPARAGLAIGRTGQCPRGRCTFVGRSPPPSVVGRDGLAIGRFGRFPEPPAVILYLRPPPPSTIAIPPPAVNNRDHPPPPRQQSITPD